MRQDAIREPRRATFTAGAYPAITPQRLAEAAARQRPARPRRLLTLRGEVRWLTATMMALALVLGFTLQRTWSGRERDRVAAAERARGDSLALAAARDSLRMTREQLTATTRAVARAVEVWSAPAQPRFTARQVPAGSLALRREAAAFSRSPVRPRAAPADTAAARPPAAATRPPDA